MSKVIYKKELPIAGRFTIPLQVSSHILCVQVQNNKPCIWFMTEAPKVIHNEIKGAEVIEPGIEARTFRIIGTGHVFDKKELVYIGTFQLEEGRFVGHLFEEF